MFLWSAIDRSNVLEQIPHNPEIEDVIYLPGVVVWRSKHSGLRASLAGVTVPDS